VDTINANGGNAGLHSSVFKKYFQPLKDRAAEETGRDLTELTAAELETIKTEATTSAKEAAQGEYFACLFLLLADDERYGPLKTQPNNNFLMGKQEYPSDVLAAKRLMTDFVPATGAVKHKRQESGPSDVAFVETVMIPLGPGLHAIRHSRRACARWNASHDAHSARMGPGVLHFCSAPWCQCLRELWHSVPSAAQCQVHGRHSRSQASQCLDCG